MKYSIIIVTYKRLELLKRCLESIEASPSKYECQTYIVINGDDPESEKFLKEEYPQIQVTQSSAKTPGEARNLAIKKATGSWLCFLDDDIIIPRDYFEKAEEIIQDNPEIDVFGGPDENYPDSSKLESAIALTLTSPLATAHTRYRHRSSEAEIIHHTKENRLILCNLWIKYEVLKETNLEFDKRFFRNEENVLLFQLKNADKNLSFIPSLYVYHKKKSNLRSLGIAVQSSGSHRLRSILLFPSSFSLLYFIPCFFVSYLLLLPLFYLFKAADYAYYPLAVYMLFNILGSFYVCFKRNAWQFLHLIPIIQFTINFHYGMGFLKEWLRFLSRRTPYS